MKETRSLSEFRRLSEFTRLYPNEFSTNCCVKFTYTVKTQFFLCGDYTARCSSDDHIPGVDRVLERDVVDFTLDRYDDFF